MEIQVHRNVTARFTELGGKIALDFARAPLVNERSRAAGARAQSSGLSQIVIHRLHIVVLFDLFD